MTQSNKPILEKVTAAVSSGDYESFLSFCTEDMEWNFVGDQLLRGKEAVRQYMAQAYWEPPKFMVEQLIAEDDFLIAVGKISMKNEQGVMIEYFYFSIVMSGGLKRVKWLN